MKQLVRGSKSLSTLDMASFSAVVQCQKRRRIMYTRCIVVFGRWNLRWRLCVWAGRTLVDGLRVQHLYDYYLDLLAYEIERNHVSAHSRILIKIFQLLPLLGPINAEQAVAIMNLRVDAPPGWWRVCVVKMAVFGQRTFPDICPIYDLQVTTLWVDWSLCQPTRPTQPSIPPGSVDDPCDYTDHGQGEHYGKWQTRAAYGCRSKSVGVG